MMSKNVEHKPTKFPELPDRPTPAVLEIVPEGRGVRSALIFRCPVYNMGVYNMGVRTASILWCPVYNTYGGQVSLNILVPR